MTSVLHETLQELTLGKVECPDLEPMPDGTRRKKDLFANADDARRSHEITCLIYPDTAHQVAYTCSSCEGFHLKTKAKTGRRELHIPNCPPAMRTWTGKRHRPKRRSRCRRKKRARP